jgi:hypothetical protein
MSLEGERTNADGPWKWQKRPSSKHDVLHFGDCVDAVLDGLCMLIKGAVEHAFDTSNVVHGPLLVPQADDLHSCRRIFRSASIKIKKIE